MQVDRVQQLSTAKSQTGGTSLITLFIPGAQNI